MLVLGKLIPGRECVLISSVLFEMVNSWLSLQQLNEALLELFLRVAGTLTVFKEDDLLIYRADSSRSAWSCGL